MPLQLSFDIENTTLEFWHNHLLPALTAAKDVTWIEDNIAANLKSLTKNVHKNMPTDKYLTIVYFTQALLSGHSLLQIRVTSSFKVTQSLVDMTLQGVAINYPHMLIIVSDDPLLENSASGNNNVSNIIKTNELEHVMSDPTAIHELDMAQSVTELPYVTSNFSTIGPKQTATGLTDLLQIIVSLKTTNYEVYPK